MNIVQSLDTVQDCTVHTVQHPALAGLSAASVTIGILILSEILEPFSLSLINLKWYNLNQMYMYLVPKLLRTLFDYGDRTDLIKRLTRLDSNTSPSSCTLTSH